MMDDAARLALYDRELRMNPPLPGAAFRLERNGSVVRLLGPSAAAHDNCIIYSGLDAATADAAIGREIAHFAAAGHAFEWKVHEHDAPGDLGERLLRHGFAPEPPETVIVRDLGDDPPRPPAAPMITIRKLDANAPLSDFVDVQNLAWNEDHAWLGEALVIERAADPKQIEILVAYADDKPVATSYMRLHRGTSFGSLWGAATLPSLRRRGIYTALAEHHAATAVAVGARLLTVDANDNSRPVLAKLGFRPLVRVQAFVWSPPR